MDMPCRIRATPNPPTQAAYLDVLHAGGVVLLVVPVVTAMLVLPQGTAGLAGGGQERGSPLASYGIGGQ